MIKNVSFPAKCYPQITIDAIEDIDFSNYDTYNRADFYQFIWINEGRPTFEIDMNTFTISPNSYVFIGKGMIYKLDAFNEYNGYIVSFTDLFFSRTEEESAFLHDALIFNNSSTCMIRPLLSHQMNIGYYLEIYKEKDAPLRDNLLHAITKMFLLYAERRTRQMVPFRINSESREQSIAIGFRNLLKQNMLQHREISFYADKLGVSPKQLIQATKKIYGQTPKEAIISKIIMEAKRLLVYSGLTVKEVAYTLGFKEPNNFSVFFQKYTGELPGNYRKALLSGHSDELVGEDVSIHLGELDEHIVKQMVSLI